MELNWDEHTLAKVIARSKILAVPAISFEDCSWEKDENENAQLASRALLCLGGDCCR